MRSRSTFVFGALLAASVATTAPARAQQRPGEPTVAPKAEPSPTTDPKTDAKAESKPEQSDEKKDAKKDEKKDEPKPEEPIERPDHPPRPVPNYDGREPEPATAGDVALWVPRVILFPLYVVSEYVIRRPFGWLITTAEKNQLPTVLLDFFTFGEERKVGIYPTAFLEFGFKPSVGLYFFANEAFHKKNDIRLFASTWGLDWLSLGAVDRLQLFSTPAEGGGVKSEGHAQIRVNFLRRPDQTFFGFGPLSRPEDDGRYSFDRFEVAPSFDIAPVRGLRLRTETGLRTWTFSNDACCGTAVLERVQQSRYPTPVGFDRDYTIGFARAEGIVDSRPRRPKSQSGVRVRGFAEHDTNLRGDPGSWIRYGGMVGGFWDITRSERVLGLTLETELVDPLSGAPPPFTENVVVGGLGMMRGFRPGRLYGRSAAAATISYEWPIWAFLDGAMHAAFGNVWGPGLSGLDPSLARMSSGIGLRTRNSPDHQVEFIVGFGTEPLKDGFEISQFRLAFGATRGF